MLIYVTNRQLCKDDFFKRVNQLAQGKPYGIMLREKDLSVPAYEDLAVKVKAICDLNQVALIINGNIETAEKLEIPNIHLSMADLRVNRHKVHLFNHVGVSVHSVPEAREALKLGASCLVAGHIFSTSCKKGVPPRGLAFLKEVCDSVPIPVFAIGGITRDKAKDLTNAGAKGICMMSEAMTSLEPSGLAEAIAVSFGK